MISDLVLRQSRSSLMKDYFSQSIPTIVVSITCSFGFLRNEIKDISYIMIEIKHVTTLTPASLPPLVDAAYI